MAQSRAQLVAPIGNVDVNGGIIVSGATTAGSLSGNIAGTATGLSGTPNLNVGIITATSYVGDGSALTGIAATPFVGQNVTSVSGVTTVNLSSGNVIYFTHNTDTTVAFANTTTTQSVTFIRTKDDTTTVRNITWPSSFVWNNGVTPSLMNDSSSGDAQQFNFLTRDGGVTWYAREEVNYNPVNYELYAWGYNTQGEVGSNDRTQYSSPVQVPGTTWRSINAGREFSLATKTDGTLWAWGYNGQGQLGQNGGALRQSSPTQIHGTTWNVILGARDSSFATKTDGTLWSWGYNAQGQLGQNNITQYSSPIQIPGTTWSSIGSAAASTFATKTDGTLWAWGNNSVGELAQNDRTQYSSPRQIPGTTWSSVSDTYFFVLAKKTDGTLWSWGNNLYGQLGQNNRIYYSSPVQIPGTTWNSIGGGVEFALATKTDGTLWAWGINTYGQLGQNNITRYSSPVQIPGTTWSTVGSSDRGFPSLATKTDGTLWGWGNNAYGELAQSNRSYYSSPVQIPGTSWRFISPGANHVLTLQLAP